MSAAHTPGKLTLLPRQPTMVRGDGGKRHVCATDSLGEGDTNEANARRLAACWNAFDGLDTETVESIVNVSEFFFSHVEVKKQRDDLLAAARRAVLALAFAAESSPAMLDDYKALSAAIAAAQGEQNHA